MNKITVLLVGSKRKLNLQSEPMTSNLYPKSFVAIDFENLGNRRLYACQIGMVKYIDGVKQAETFDNLICPPPLRKEDELSSKKCEWAVRKTHSITWNQVKGEKTFLELLPEIEAFIGDLPLVAHNKSVESGCFRENAEYYKFNTTIDYENIIDTQELYCSLFAEKVSHGLEAVCEYYGIKVNNHHNAVCDAEMCGGAYLKIIEDLPFGTNPKKLSKSSKIAKKPSKHTDKYIKEDKTQRKDLENVSDNTFKNCYVVLTGFKDSQYWGHKLWEMGAILRDDISGKTQILIYDGTNGYKKLEKAQKQGVQILTKEELCKIISEYEREKSI